MRAPRKIAIIVLGLGVGAAAGKLSVLDGREGGASPYDEERSVASLELPGATTDRDDTPTAATTTPAAPAAATPSEAVDRFLRAELAGDFAASFGLLAADDRAAFANPAVWERQHGVLPTLVDYAITGTRDEHVDADLMFVPALDPTLGLVAGRARATFTVAAEGGGWRVVYAATEIAQQFADDSGIVPAAERWLDARRACTTPGNEWSGGLLGDGAPAIADALCDAAAARVGVSGPPADRPELEPFLATFGPDAAVWARAVDVRAGGHRFELVLAPVGEQWLVVGAITASPVRS